MLSDFPAGADNEMMRMTDSDLLHAYAREGSQTAFTELVGRHIDLVYSAARRQVRSPDLAGEVAQSVFLDLARNACGLDGHAPLVAWLHLVTRRTAIDVIRREARRQARERSAAETLHEEATANAMKSTSAEWQSVEPLLDEAVDALPEKDRTAILLRFFQNKNLREVGAALGLSDDAAQKRVSRALDQLRAFFVRRGVPVSAAGLTATLSAHAIEAAPAGLGAAISGSAAIAATAAASVTAEAAKVIAMTTLQKTALVAVFVAAGGAGLYEVLRRSPWVKIMI